MLKFLQEDEIYINAAKIIEIFVLHDCQTTSTIFYQIVKFPSLGKKNSTLIWQDQNFNFEPM